MANSDNVLRGGLTSKHVDVPELMATLRFDAGRPEPLIPDDLEPLETCFLTPADEFELGRVHAGADRVFESAEDHGVEILLCTEGSGRMVAGSSEPELSRGTVSLVPASAPAYRIDGMLSMQRARVRIRD